uniref:Uncharacterized protein n=1 Tax=Oryza glumipatula TaxID=40148 RepID=A0A0D9YD18_9ORYZ
MALAIRFRPLALLTRSGREWRRAPRERVLDGKSGSRHKHCTTQKREHRRRSRATYCERCSALLCSLRPVLPGLLVALPHSLSRRPSESAMKDVTNGTLLPLYRPPSRPASTPSAAPLPRLSRRLTKVIGRDRRGLDSSGFGWNGSTARKNSVLTTTARSTRRAAMYAHGWCYGRPRELLCAMD